MEPTHTKSPSRLLSTFWSVLMGVLIIVLIVLPQPTGSLGGLMMYVLLVGGLPAYLVLLFLSWFGTVTGLREILLEHKVYRYILLITAAVLVVWLGWSWTSRESLPDVFFFTLYPIAFVFAYGFELFLWDRLDRERQGEGTD